MHSNINKMIERGDQIETLMEKSQKLNEQAGKFESSATTLKKTMRCRNWKVGVCCRLAIASALIARR
jgi:vesicle-associated membrane protein 7